jgi:hypothetical protein
VSCDVKISNATMVVEISKGERSHLSALHSLGLAQPDGISDILHDSADHCPTNTLLTRRKWSTSEDIEIWPLMIKAVHNGKLADVSFVPDYILRLLCSTSVQWDRITLVLPGVASKVHQTNKFTKNSSRPRRYNHDIYIYVNQGSKRSATVVSRMESQKYVHCHTRRKSN